jgi:hypothetical protein
MPDSSGFRCSSGPIEGIRNDATCTPGVRHIRSDLRNPVSGLSSTLPVVIRATETSRRLGRLDAGRLSRVPLRHLGRRTQTVCVFPPFDGFRKIPRYVQPAGAESLSVLSRSVILPKLPYAQRRTEAQHADGRPSGLVAAASGRLRRNASTGWKDGPRILFPVPWQQERCEVPRLSSIGLRAGA